MLKGGAGSGSVVTGIYLETLAMPHIVIGQPALAQFRADGLEKTALLLYRGSKGEEKERLVTIHTVGGTVEADEKLIPDHLAGYCHVRKMPRTFVCARISRAIDPETGEIIEDILTYLGVTRHEAGI